VASKFLFLRIFVFLFALTFLCNQSSFAQSESDLISWSSIKVSNSINDRVSFYAQPIIRHTQDLSKYNDFSIDLDVAYKLSSQWSVSFLNRYWWLSNGTNRNFWFFDLKHAFKPADKISISNMLRIHQAFDVDFADADFLRWLPAFQYKLSKKLSVFIATDISLRLNGFNNIQRTRSKIGANYSLSDKFSFHLQFWKQDNYRPSRDGSQIMIVPSLAYKL